MDADRVDDAEQPAIAHQPQPVQVGGAGTAKHRTQATLLHPMGGGTGHLAEQQPVVVLLPVPVEQVVRFVPDFDWRKTGRHSG